MGGVAFPARLAPEIQPLLGLVALQSDETIEADFRRLMPEGTEWMVSRVPCGVEVTPETLAAMENHHTEAASLFPVGAEFATIGYGCTSGTALIGAGRVHELIAKGAKTDAVTEPVSALVAAAFALNIKTLAFLSPYTAPVSGRLREVLATSGIETPVFGSFEIACEREVVRIDGDSIRSAALHLMQGAEVDALFLSCTNLRTLDLIDGLEAELGKAVLSSNQVLAWHMLSLAKISASGPGRLFSLPRLYPPAPAS